MNKMLEFYRMISDIYVLCLEIFLVYLVVLRPIIPGGATQRVHIHTHTQCTHGSTPIALPLLSLL